jgi:uncharacterized Zn ribbon protein
MSSPPKCPKCNSKYTYENGIGPMSLKSEFVKKA